MGSLTFVVPPAFDGQTVQSFLRMGCGLSWRMVVKLKRVCDGITVDGEHKRTIDRVSVGQTVTVNMPEDAVKIEGASIPLQVAFEDEQLLVVDKPPFLAVHPSAGKPEPTLANAVVGYFAERGENLSFRPISRLDRNTSGLLPIAKNPHIAFAMAHTIEKTYLAIVCGELTGEGLIDQPIRVKEGSLITREVGEGGKESKTLWRSLGTDGEVSLILVKLLTGRTHQIRVHLSHLGYPLVGDTMYGTDTALPRHALHCTRLCFSHPVTGEKTDLHSPLPPDMAEFLESHNIRRIIDDQSLCI